MGRWFKKPHRDNVLLLYLEVLMSMETDKTSNEWKEKPLLKEEEKLKEFVFFSEEFWWSLKVQILENEVLLTGSWV